ncbi:MAG: hypothetical protein RBR43_10440 [Desulfuromonadaceae bacterium]|nr:hypothetical protein [Desulfuromonadaceae bacterium]
MDAGTSGLGSAVQDPVDPLGGYGVQAVHSAQERPTNGRIGIGVSTPCDCIDDTRFKVRGIEQLPQGITKRDQHPALLLYVVSRWRFDGAMDGVHESWFDCQVGSPLFDILVELLGLAARCNSVSNRHSEKRVSLHTHRVWMRQSGVLSGPVANRFQWVVGPEDAQGADPHHGPVGLTVGVRTPPETSGNGHAAVKRIGVEPELIGLKRGIGIIGPTFCQHTGQQQRHFRVVRRLTGNGVPGTAIGQFPHAIRVAAVDLLRRLKLDQAAESISGKLAKEAAPGS